MGKLSNRTKRKRRAKRKRAYVFDNPDVQLRMLGCFEGDYWPSGEWVNPYNGDMSAVEKTATGIAQVTITYAEYSDFLTFSEWLALDSIVPKAEQEIASA